MNRGKRITPTLSIVTVDELPDTEPDREPIRPRAIPRCVSCGELRQLDGRSECHACASARAHDEGLIDVIAHLEDITQGEASERCADAARMLRRLLRRKK